MAVTSASRCERVAKLHVQERSAACVLADQTKLLLSLTLAKAVTVGDEISLPIPESDAVGSEILVAKSAATGPSRYIYQAPIGYVSQLKQDKRNQYFVSAEVHQGSLGTSTVCLPAEVLRNYFYNLPYAADTMARPTLYEVLRVRACAAPCELRVAFKLRVLELRSPDSPGERRLENSRCLVPALPDHSADRVLFRVADQRDSRVAADVDREEAESRENDLVELLGILLRMEDRNP